MKKINKAFSIIIVIVAILVLSSQKSISKATIGDINYLQRAEKGFYSIEGKKGSDWIYVTYSRTYYTDDNGVKRVAYCIDPDLKGIGWIKGEYEGYDVKVKELLSDQRLWRVYTNGYPYKTPAELGVETEDDAYLATKMATYAILRSYTIEDVRNNYRTGTTKVENQNFEDIQRRGNKVIDAICNLVEIGYNGKETIQYNNILKIVNKGELVKDDIDENYYSIICQVQSEVECSEYRISEILGFPEGSIVVNNKGEGQTVFNGNETFKLMVPKEKIKDNISGSIKIIGKCKNYPVYYSECNVGNFQNYMLCCDEYSNDISATCNMNINVNKCNLQINKIDKDEKIPIKGVKFSIKYKDGTDLGIFETNEKGKINLNNIKPGDLVVKEIETENSYILNSEIQNVKLEYNESQNIIFENEKKKGTIKIIKVDEDNNEIKIQGVKFQVYNDSNILIKEIVTDINGEAVIGNLPIDSKYIIKEVETASDYILSEEFYEIELKENEVKNVVINNKKLQKKVEKQAEKLPRTGMIDFSNQLLGISIAGFMVNIGLLKKKK